METIEIKDIKSMLPYFIKYKKIWADYDKEADILYMHFKKPNNPYLHLKRHLSG